MPGSTPGSPTAEQLRSAFATERESTMATKSVKQTVRFIRSTKGTHVYAHDVPEGTDIPKNVPTTSLYIQKGAFPDANKPPEKIIITFEFPN